MCLATKDIIPKIAYEDIVCYKYVEFRNENYISIPQGFIYKKSETYNNNIPLATNAEFYIDFIDKKRISSNGYLLGPNLFHSYKNKPNLYLDKFERYLKCIIPKGAYYWENKHFYASSQIKILEEI